MSESVGQWWPDPFGRHEYRYWGGSEWTEHVADRGQMSVDAPEPAGAGVALPPPPAPQMPAGSPPAPVVYVMPPRNNGLAIAAMVLGIVWVYWIGSILALIFGYVALSQIKKSGGGQRGRGMAIAGVVLGWVGVAALAAVIVVVALNAHTISNSTSCYDDAQQIRSAEADFYQSRGYYGSESELVNAGFLDRSSDRHDIELVGAGVDYRLVDQGSCR